MNFKQARVGDVTTHGGQIITGDSIRYTDGKKVARRGDLISCPEHGVVMITSTLTSPLFTTGKDTARLASQGACGCQIITGSDVTSHKK